VGKSTLLNAIDPNIAQRTAEISDYSEKGTHTTTFAEMFKTNADTYIIDTPGIKEYGLVDIDNDELAQYFPEMRALSDECKFYNCTHLHEPGCAVLAALELGKIPPSRYNSYLSILEGEDNRR
jgi:ribosome biogenesis GTPase / thiamine phosphate phosphatase